MVKEDANEPQDALDQQVEPKYLNQKNQCAARCYQQKESEDGGEDTLQEDQPPGKGRFSHSQISRCCRHDLSPYVDPYVECCSSLVTQQGSLPHPLAQITRVIFVRV